MKSKLQSQNLAPISTCRITKFTDLNTVTTEYYETKLCNIEIRSIPVGQLLKNTTDYELSCLENAEDLSIFSESK